VSPLGRRLRRGRARAVKHEKQPYEVLLATGAVKTVGQAAILGGSGATIK